MDQSRNMAAMETAEGTTSTSVADTFTQDIYECIAGALDRRDVAAFRASCKLAYRATNATRQSLAIDTQRRPLINWGSSDWVIRFLAGFHSLRSLTHIEGGNCSGFLSGIISACFRASERSGTETDVFHAASPYGIYITLLENAPPSLRAFSLHNPKLTGGMPDLDGDVLHEVVALVPGLQELHVGGHHLVLEYDEMFPSDEPLFRPSILADTVRQSLRTLVLHCLPSGTALAMREGWALELAQLDNLTVLDLGRGTGDVDLPEVSMMGIAVPWTRSVAEAWQVGLTRLQKLSVRLTLCSDDTGAATPLQTHGLALPVSNCTTDLAVFFDDYRNMPADAPVAHEPREYVDAAALLLAHSLERCAAGVESLEVHLLGVQSREAAFAAAEVLLGPATPQARLAAVTHSGLQRLRRLSLGTGTTVELLAGLRHLALKPGLELLEFTIDDLTTGEDLLQCLDLGGGRKAIHLRIESEAQPLVQWEAMEEPAQAAFVRKIFKVLGMFTRDVRVSHYSFSALPSPAFPDMWKMHLDWLACLGDAKVTQVELRFSYQIVSGERWHETTDIEAHLRALSRLPHLAKLSICIFEDRETRDDKKARGQLRRAVAHWRAARAAAKAGQDIERWRPCGTLNPVPRLHFLARMPCLEHLNMEFDLLSNFGLSGMVEDEVRQLYEVLAEQPRWATTRPAGLLEVRCPQLSRDAARRLSRLAVELWEAAVAAAAAPPDEQSGNESSSESRAGSDEGDEGGGDGDGGGSHDDGGSGDTGGDVDEGDDGEGGSSDQGSDSDVGCSVGGDGDENSGSNWRSNRSRTGDAEVGCEGAGLSGGGAACGGGGAEGGSAAREVNTDVEETSASMKVVECAGAVSVSSRDALTPAANVSSRDALTPAANGAAAATSPAGGSDGGDPAAAGDQEAGVSGAVEGPAGSSGTPGDSGSGPGGSGEGAGGWEAGLQERRPQRRTSFWVVDRV